jgi:hypothetical protein
MTLAAVADDGVTGLAAGGVPDVDHHIGADVLTLRIADQRMCIVRRYGSAQQGTNGVRIGTGAVRPHQSFARAIDGPQVHGDAVGR